jgi:hypothetical protein
MQGVTTTAALLEIAAGVTPRYSPLPKVLNPAEDAHVEGKHLREASSGSDAGEVDR